MTFQLWIGRLATKRPATAALAAALVLVLAGAARAQTVTVTNATPGATVEAVWNMTPVGTATIDALGNASIPLNQLADDATLDVRVVVDTCDRLWRVFVERVGLTAPPPQAGCARQEIAGVFVVRPISTLVVGVSGSTATLRLRQGPFDPTAPIQTEAESPGGLVLYGGGGLSAIGGDLGRRACGDVGQCESGGTGFGYTTGVMVWFAPYLGAEVGLFRPSGFTAEADAGGLRFTTDLDASAVTVAGLVGIPISNARIFGKVGFAFHEATTTTVQTIDPATIEIDEETTITTPGGTQTLELGTSGRGLLFGGGIEVWANRVFGFFLEAGSATLKGPDRDGGEGALDDRAFYVVAGLRLHVAF